MSKKLISILIILILVLGIGVFALIKLDNKELNIYGDENVDIYKEEDVKKEEEIKLETIDNGIIVQKDVDKNKKIKIVDEDLKTPIYAISIDNVGGAIPQSGLSKSFVTYEVIVEGGLTRILAVFKDVDLERVGPIRSARHYFLDLAAENNAILTHFGESYVAKDHIRKYGVKDIDGIVLGSKYFYRYNKKYAPHNVFTDFNRLEKLSKKFEIEDKELLFNYSKGIVDFKEEQSKSAIEVYLPYPNAETSYVYDKENKVYNRFENGKKHIDALNNKQITVKNIIIQKVENHNYKYQNTVLQDLENQGVGEGYYITNGRCISIKWQKNNRWEKTIFKDLKGNEIVLNDGNTFVQIHPINQKEVIKGEKIESTEDTENI